MAGEWITAPQAEDIVHFADGTEVKVERVIAIRGNTWSVKVKDRQGDYKVIAKDNHHWEIV